MRGRDHTYGQAHCCIACGVGLCFALPEMVREESEEWKSLLAADRAKYAIVSPKDVEEMFFHRLPWLWSIFYRASQRHPFH
jgi:hypothetical protein